MDKERIGSAMGGVSVLSDCLQSLFEKGFKRISPFMVPYTVANMTPALIAIELGLMGPNYSISNACAASNHSFYAAASRIRRGGADVMIAGVTEAVIVPVVVGGFVACKALSQRSDDPQTASRPWDRDRDRDGFVISECFVRSDDPQTDT